jgi:hypothetical protein
MQSETCHLPAEIALQPSRGLALCLGIVGLLALLAVWASSLSFVSGLALCAAIALAAASCIRGFLRPNLSLRVTDEGFQYREGPGGPWISFPPGARCFASPWYIGWRGRRWRAHGVFRAQLPPDQYRRLLVALRHRPAA